MATSVLVSLIVLLSFHGFQVDGKVDRYAFNIVTNGTSFIEQVEVDVENKTEVVRVPQHNNEESVEIMNDFDAGLSVRRFPASQDCHVSKLDSSFPSPAKLKADMDQASKQSALPDKVETKRTGWSVVGFANRSALPEKILDFCGSFPIYNVEAVPLDSMNVTLHRVSGHGRKKRHHWKSYYYPCSSADIAKMTACLTKDGHLKVKITCKYITKYCYYRALCTHQPQPADGVLNPTYLPGYSCTSHGHFINFAGICCSGIC